jgi:hypothetical protein
MTLAELIVERDKFIVAQDKILKSQEYQIGSAGHARRSRMAELEIVVKQINFLNAQIAPLQQAAAGVRRVRYFRTC